MSSLDPVIDKVFAEALAKGASDIHLEPAEGDLVLRFRIRGRMEEVSHLPKELAEGLLAKLKLMAGCNPTVRHISQDGAFVVNGLETRFSVIPVLGGESVVIRLLRKLDELARWSGLGMTPSQCTALEAALAPGLFVIAGPTGAGKTTTFYATLRALDAGARKIITVEDPVEQHLDGVCQVGVTQKLSFAAALKSILRQSPDVIGVGELRDRESLEMAMQAALTGHLVVVTLHASSAAEVSARLLEMGAAPAILSQVLQAVVAQRLVNIAGDKGPLRTGLFEAVAPSLAMRGMIRAGAPAREIEQLLFGEGLVSIRDQAKNWVASGRLSQGEFLTEFGA